MVFNEVMVAEYDMGSRSFVSSPPTIEEPLHGKPVLIEGFAGVEGLTDLRWRTEEANFVLRKALNYPFEY